MEPKRLFDFIYYQKEHYPLERAFGSRADGKWKFISTGQAIETADQVSRGLLKMGVKPGDKIAVAVYQNRPEWVVMDIGILQIGAINVPVYPTISPTEYEYIFNDSQVKYAFVGKGDLFAKVSQAQQNVPSLEKVFCFDRQEGRPYWEDIFSHEGQEEVERLRAGVKAEDLATIIYTSGTTGHPKGVMLSHRNIVSNVLAVKTIFPCQEGDRVLSFLPICHSFERAALYVYTYCGGSIAFTGTENLGGDEGDLKSVQPHFFTTVPRLLEKVYEKIYNKGLTLTGLKKRLFFWALSLTEDFEYDKKYRGMAAFKRRIADKLIFSKWRAALGGSVKGIVTGAAPCPIKMLQVFSAAGIPIREGYGLTETSPGLAIGRFEPGGAMLGTIGPALDGVELRIDSSGGQYREGEGEILARGPNIMLGYYNKPEATAEVTKEIDGQHWFCTGDIGMLVEGPHGRQFIQITDRKKELLKTSGGKYVAPAPVENKLKEDFLVEQVMVVGDSRKFVSALIVPAQEALQGWCEEHGLEWSSLETAVQHPRVVEKYQRIIDQYNPLFSKVEQVKKFKLVPSNWEAVKADGSAAELTPTMKLKRRVIMEKYAADIEALYTDQA